MKISKVELRELIREVLEESDWKHRDGLPNKYEDPAYREYMATFGKGGGALQKKMLDEIDQEMAEAPRLAPVLQKDLELLSQLFPALQDHFVFSRGTRENLSNLFMKLTPKTRSKFPKTVAQYLSMDDSQIDYVESDVHQMLKQTNAYKVYAKRFGPGSSGLKDITGMLRARIQYWEDKYFAGKASKRDYRVSRDVLNFDISRLPKFVDLLSEYFEHNDLMSGKAAYYMYKSFRSKPCRAAIPPEIVDHLTEVFSPDA